MDKSSIAEILNKHTVSDLKEMAQVYSAEGLEKARKQDYVDTLSRMIIDENHLKEVFLAAGKMEMKQLDDAVKGNVMVHMDSYEYYYWRKIPVVFVSGRGEVIVPAEIAAFYDEFCKNDVMMNKRKKIDTADEYLCACTNLYNVIEIAKFLEIINGQTGMDYTKKELISWLELREKVRGRQVYFYSDGYIMNDMYGIGKEGERPDYHSMLEKQGNAAFYVPSKKELLCYADPYYIDKNTWYLAMMGFFRDVFNLNEKHAELFASHVQLLIRHGAMPKDVFAEMSKNGIELGEGEIMNEFISILLDMYKNTRMPETRGFTASEVKVSEPLNDRQPSASEVLMSDMPIIRNKLAGQKIYPNSPCPCGSGKKFKQCCGKGKK